MAENKEEILANFQSISGIDDIGEAFSHLEETNWNLMDAIQRVMPQESANVGAGDATASTSKPSAASPGLDMPSLSPSDRATTLNNFSTAASSSNCNRWDSSNATEAAFVPVASTSAGDIIDLTSDIDLDAASKQKDGEKLTFTIYFKDRSFDVRLPSVATVDNLKSKIIDQTNVPKCRQVIRGWPPAKQNEAQLPSTPLNTLDLSQHNQLILIDLSEEGFMDDNNDSVLLQRRFDMNFILNIVEQPSGRQFTLNLNGRTTILEVKTSAYYITDIPVRHQEWTGWPQGCDNSTMLAQSGIELLHNFTLKSSADANANSASSSASYNRLNNSHAIDTDSSTDEFEDASDFNTCEEFFTDTAPVQSSNNRHLIPNNTDNEVTGSTQFFENYIARFGEPHPIFYIGSLEHALTEACHKPARERKLLAIYLHHGGSILTNVFCDHLLKHESIRQTLEQNFILYGWDLTYESNKHMFLSSVTGCISNTASITVRGIPIDKLPSILVIGKSRVSGRTTCEVLSVIHGNVGLDDLLSRLIESVELYSEHLQVEIREDDERAARDQVKAEQDMAYQETLQADMAKEAAKQQKAAAIAAERQRLESEKAEEDARKESIRLVAEQALPAEPANHDTEVSRIRIRKPTGDFLERKFYIKNTLKDLLNFVASNGFLVDEYKLIGGWPRRDLTSLDVNQTLESLKLFPQETVIIEER